MMFTSLFNTVAVSAARGTGASLPPPQPATRERARIAFSGGEVVLPAHTPYERQQVFEHVEACTKQHSTVRLDLNRRKWVVSRANGDQPTCGTCGRTLAKVAYWFAGRTLCGTCARREQDGTSQRRGR